MPEIAYTITAELTVDTIRRWAELDIYPDAFTRSPAEIGKIEACRQWVAENPEYPDGTIAYVETQIGTHWLARKLDGKWVGLNHAKGQFDRYILDVESVVYVLHTPPTMRDHLYAIGLTDQQIALRDIGDSETVLAVIWKACREAER